MQKTTIKECSDSILEIMRSKNYSESSMHAYRKIFTDFTIYCDNIGVNFFDMNVAIEYVNLITGLELTELAHDGKNTKKYIVLLRAMRLLSNYSINRLFILRFSRFVDEIENEYWKNINDKFIKYLSDNYDYKERTVNRKKYVVKKCVEVLVRHNVFLLDDITRKNVEAIISTFVHETPKSVSHNISDLKQFFKYCYENQLCSMDISKLFPILNTVHETKISNTFTQEEVKILLDSIDKESIAGKRDYAILLLAVCLGLRSVDIANLKLSNIDWEKKMIFITQEKTSKNLTLPLLNDLGWSIIDYIKNARPQIESEYLFLEHRAPFLPLTPSGISSIFTRRLRDSGIKIISGKKYGIHSLRHTLGTLLLEKETSLPMISQILGHQSIKSTETYLKLNINELSKCPIDPDRVFDL